VARNCLLSILFSLLFSLGQRPIDASHVVLRAFWRNANTRLCEIKYENDFYI